jgi:predicted RNA-binding protein YlqC (UPF0109 family)
MEIKGTAVKSIPEFVKIKYPGEYAKWMKSLPPESQQIMNTLSSANWYPITEGAITPTLKVGVLFFNGDTKKGAWELGRHSAEISLHGIYKVYVKFSSPGHIISRAGRIITAYYRPSQMEVADRKANSVKLIMTKFDMPSEVIEHRIGGWIEKALEISGCNGVEVKVSESLTKGSTKTVYDCSWA